MPRWSFIFHCGRGPAESLCTLGGWSRDPRGQGGAAGEAPGLGCPSRVWGLKQDESYSLGWVGVRTSVKTTEKAEHRAGVHGVKVEGSAEHVMGHWWGAAASSAGCRPRWGDGSWPMRGHVLESESAHSVPGTTPSVSPLLRSGFSGGTFPRRF